MPETGLLFSPKDLRRLILPLIVEQLLSIFLGMADISGVAAYVDKAVAAAKAKGARKAVILNISAPFHSRLKIGRAHV